MSSEKRPWYKWYPKDFNTDEKVQSLSPMSELIYRRLLDVMWQSNRCLLLNVCLRLANTAGKGLPYEEFEKCWQEIQTPGFELFKTTDDGKYIYSQRLMNQMQMLEIKKEAGKKGGIASAKQRASKSQAKAKQTLKQTFKQTPTDTDTDTDTDIKKKNTKKKKVDDFILPNWMEPYKKEWEEFIRHRMQMRKPMTPYAKELAVNSIKRLMETGYGPDHVINTCIEKGWQGIYEPKSEDPNAMERLRKKYANVS